MSNERTLKVNHSNIVIKVVDNKYRKKVTASGLILPEDGLHFSQETGQVEKNLEEIIALAEIIAVGPECKYYVTGDDVYVDTRSLRPIPFDGRGYFCTNEQNVLCGVE